MTWQGGNDWGFGVLQHIFFSGGGEKEIEKKKTQGTKSRIICTFTIVEKVRPIRQLKKEAITLDEDR